MNQDALRNYQKTALYDVELLIGIGVHDRERGTRQRVIVDVDAYRYSGSFTGKRLEDCWNYEDIFDYLTREWPARGHTELLETLAEDLVAFCLRDPRVEACRVRLRKPDVFGGAAVPEVEFFRVREI